MRYLILLALVLLAIATAQTAEPSQLTLSPVGASANCVASPGGDVLCAGNDGFYVSISGGPFAKVATGAQAQPTQLTCTTATLSSGATGSLTASGCTFK